MSDDFRGKSGRSIAELEAELDAIRSDRDRLHSDNAANVKLVASLKEQNGNIQKQLDELQSKAGKPGAKAAVPRVGVKTTKPAPAAAAPQPVGPKLTEAEQNKLALAQKMLERKDEELEGMQNDLRAARVLVEKTKSQLQRRPESATIIAQLQGQLGVADQKRQALEEEVKTLQKEVRLKAKVIAEMDAELKKLKTPEMSVEHQLRDAKKRVHDLDEQASRDKTVIARLTKQLQTSQHSQPAEATATTTTDESLRKKLHERDRLLEERDKHIKSLEKRIEVLTRQQRTRNASPPPQTVEEDIAAPSPPPFNTTMERSPLTSPREKRERTVFGDKSGKVLGSARPKPKSTLSKLNPAQSASAAPISTGTGLTDATSTSKLQTLLGDVRKLKAEHDDYGNQLQMSAEAIQRLQSSAGGEADIQRLETARKGVKLKYESTLTKLKTKKDEIKVLMGSDVGAKAAPEAVAEAQACYAQLESITESLQQL